MFTTRPELTGDFGMVAGTHWLAAATGMSVLERGGNAFDAAVAAGFVLQVAEPHLNGPGGEVPILLWSEAERKVSVVCGQGVAPAAATIDRFTSGLGLDLVPGTGLLAATVPGAFGGWLLLLERWGTWPLADVLEPAISYAERGVPVVTGMAATIGTVERLFAEHWPTSAATWLPGGAVPAPGSRLANPVLAATYRRVVAEARAASPTREGQIAAARAAWYSGFVAESIAKFCAETAWRDTSGEVHGGLLTGDDMAAWRAGVEEPVTFGYHGHTVCKTGPWGQGPVFLQQLALLAGHDLTAMGHLSPDYIHTVTEAAKLAFADREAWYGDSAEVPVSDLLAEAYAGERRALIGATASLLQRPGSPGGRSPRLPAARGVGAGPQAGAGEPTVRADGAVSGDTCHIDVVDRHGNMVSATPSGGWLQSSPTIPDLGFCLGTRAQMFWLEEGLPNSLRPGARPRTTLSPSFALRDGRPWLAFGTPGGDQQDQWSLNFFLSVVHFGLNLQEAIDAPMFHSEHFPSSFYPRESRPGVLAVEDRVPGAVLAELRRRGHIVEPRDPWSLGRLSAVAREDFLKAAANPRGAQGYAVGR
ncbi:gamma-glutamyltranspeptidase/glutathione hydrolase [Thermocatellispora tengchongensis]|uniref:Gamma-glutamyltranspeptidase/glutathione hydrolase n=1 Tax=Thermocatellispora tengchongensis TaxID=1073253 RepID=A0A840PTG4_9ACTN|nr:gamma-glutamyltransferase family protein [Thermocatellispora tengchongensis]MBB5140427.1 gamma-glutamyltranspeptidase/glutathione hydrolase [Thermocatellispora tengchongensis]